MWLQLAYALVMMVVSYALQLALAPKPQQPTAGNLDVPTAEPGGFVPVVFGENVMKGTNIIWYGDARTEAIKSDGGKKG